MTDTPADAARLAREALERANVFELAGMLPREVALLRSLAAALLSALEREARAVALVGDAAAGLARYCTHAVDCDIWQHATVERPTPCACGLDALLARLRDLADGGEAT